MKISKQKELIKLMIEIYCKGNKHVRSNGDLCPDCQELLDYSHLRLSKCPFQDEKPFCSKCPHPCYKKDKKEQIKAVMKYSGKRLMFKHPLIVLKHVFSDLKK